MAPGVTSGSSGGRNYSQEEANSSPTSSTGSGSETSLPSVGCRGPCECRTRDWPPEADGSHVCRDGHHLASNLNLGRGGARTPVKSRGSATCLGGGFGIVVGFAGEENPFRELQHMKPGPALGASLW